jgi:hypothetical protein
MGEMRNITRTARLGKMPVTPEAEQFATFKVRASTKIILEISPDPPLTQRWSPGFCGHSEHAGICVIGHQMQHASQARQQSGFIHLE